MWCPQHRWEFSNPSVTTCPSCGTELVAELPRGTEPEAVALLEPPTTGDSVTATKLGAFDRLAVPMLLDMLHERGIRAFEESQVANPITRSFDPMHLDVWVESGRVVEARKIAEEDLPALAQATFPEELEPESVSAPDEGEEGEGADGIGWTPFGWMETPVAITFLQICEEEGISAQTEYPLDRPPPPWATPGMRVQVYVDALFVDEAERLLERVEQRLDEQGIDWEDPLCDLSGP